MEYCTHAGEKEAPDCDQLCCCFVNPLLWLVCRIASLTPLLIRYSGYDQGMMGGVNNAKDYIDLMGFGYTEMKDGQPTPVVTNSLLQGGIVAVYYLGTLCGCLLGGWIGDSIGRIKTIASGAVWAIFGAALQCSAQNHNWMICGKASVLTSMGNFAVTDQTQPASSTGLAPVF
jgi:MFS family permease